MYGDDLLVAPVTEPGFESWDVYLPGKEQVLTPNYSIETFLTK